MLQLCSGYWCAICFKFGILLCYAVVNKMRNAINAEQSKVTEQMKIAEWGTEQLEITMNPHAWNNCIRGTDKLIIHSC